MNEKRIILTFLAEQVLAQLRSMYESRSNLEEIYVMGYRLIAFYTQALPRHPHYRSIDLSISNLREKSLVDLDWIRKRLDVISLRIDEEQLNQFILREVTKPCETRQDAATHWESFSGWTSSEEERPTPVISTTPVATGEVSCTSHGIRALPAKGESVVDTSLVTKLSKMELPLEHADDPGDILDLDSDDDTSIDGDGDSLSGGDSDDRAVVFEMGWSQTDNQPDDEYDSSFLRAIAREEVKFETDSEAADSWAQNDFNDEELENILFKYDTDEGENVDPDCSIQNFPSFDEPADTVKGNALTASPQDVMNFERHRAGVRCSGEEPLPIYVSGLRI
jgi:hypothetical protein